MRMSFRPLVSAILFLVVSCATAEKTADPQPSHSETQLPESDGSALKPAAVDSDKDIKYIPNDSTDPNGTLKVLKTYIGRASWYGAKHHGRKTASGELFNKNSLTAAHRTLPFGTKVHVTNTKNGKSVIVKINDRGPFRRGLIIDLSHAAASAIGMVNAGLAGVELKILVE
jgi:rare lipoprotein A